MLYRNRYTKRRFLYESVNPVEADPELCDAILHYLDGASQDEAELGYLTADNVADFLKDEAADSGEDTSYYQGAGEIDEEQYEDFADALTSLLQSGKLRVRAGVNGVLYFCEV